MKRIVFILIAFMLLTSCRKKYNCFCNTTIQFNMGQDYYTSRNTPISEKMTKKQAQAVCDHEADDINQMYTNYWTNSGNYSANGTTFYTQCILQ
jgi:hypothetical protein